MQGIAPIVNGIDATQASHFLMFPKSVAAISLGFHGLPCVIFVCFFEAALLQHTYVSSLKASFRNVLSGATAINSEQWQCCNVYESHDSRYDFRSIRSRGSRCESRRQSGSLICGRDWRLCFTCSSGQWGWKLHSWSRLITSGWKLRLFKLRPESIRRYE